MLPHLELMEIHDCLRREVAELSERVQQLKLSAGKSEHWPDALRRLLQQFDFFFVVYHSHSKAEDDVIIPALVHKGLAEEASAELHEEHDGQSRAFEEVRILLLHLRGQDVAQLDMRRSQELRQLVDHLADLVDRIRASVMLHFRKEEEELFPLLTQSFGDLELLTLAGHILGSRSSDQVNKYLEMIIRDLPDNDKHFAIESIKEAAQGTRFSLWLERARINGVVPVDLRECRRLTAEDNIAAAPSVHPHCGDTKCCPQQQNVHHYHHYGQQQFQGLQQQQQQQQQQPSLGCKHYRRSCKLVMPCCNRLFTCRLCHDEAITEESIKNGNAVQWHQANRYEIKQMWCMRCATLQPAAASCAVCKISMASYTCNICNLYDDAQHRDIYHCPYCNVCRLGKGLGKDLVHCMKCNACISTKLKNHVCRERTLEDDCSICQTSLFDATEPLQLLDCGHFMHRKCYNDYVKTNIRCPTCRKCVRDMSMVWEKYDRFWEQVLADSAAHTPAKINLRCLQCGAQYDSTRASTSPMLVNLPDKCRQCGSYNTDCTFV
ncbi:Zinc finger protein BRUTUS [Hondaea fermentalgiana]|uniref:Zinc finger protein BRUTUS n=1 Tax=Hondaea fermentalgiana TaxID=2315210 RepID=A0A2R5GTZ9_9STRA|nr:Zinc finger protein BRUTUS [Hondaea fermentalgiana]|eukprot:GBG34342.1 Zinc finger protein BRUTUS [Hondaea fermentalgiana]